MVGFARSGGLWPPLQSIDIIPQNLLLLRVFSHGSHSSCCVYSPTDFTEFTELLAACILPQISQIYTELLAEIVLPQISQNSQIVWVPSRGCTCLIRSIRCEISQAAESVQSVVKFSKQQESV